MNPIETLQDRIQKEFPKAILALEMPSGETGAWWLDIRQGTVIGNVQWVPNRGLGLSFNPFHCYGEGPEEIHLDIESAYARIKKELK